MKTIKILYLILAITSFNTCFGQIAPPDMAMPTEENKILVSKIIEITKHEEYFVNYCSKKVNKYAVENNWTSEKTELVLKSIQFEDYNTTIYSSYAFYSTKQLTNLVSALTLLNENDPNSALRLILTNSMMQSNLDVFVDSIIKGKYVK